METTETSTCCPLCRCGLHPKEKLQLAVIGPDGFRTGEFLMIDKAAVDAAVRRHHADRAFSDRVGGYTITFGDGPTVDEVEIRQVHRTFEREVLIKQMKKIAIPFQPKKLSAFERRNKNLPFYRKFRK